MKSLYCFMLDALYTYKHSSTQKINLSKKANIIAQNITMVEQNRYQENSDNIQMDITHRLKYTEAMNWGIIATDIHNKGEKFDGVDVSVVDVNLSKKSMIGNSTMILEFSKHLDSEFMNRDFSQMDDHLRSLIFLQQCIVFS